MAVRFQLRRDTAANWTASNPVLALGEPGVETNTLKVKVGDGTTAWNSLAYSITKDFNDLTNTPTTIAGYNITDGLTLTALSVTQNTASGTGALTYNNTTGVFEYTPPDFEGLTGNFTGSVFADDSTLIVDGVNSTLNATVLTGALPAIDGSALTGVDADTLDGVDSSSYLRSDAFDRKTSGNLLFENTIDAVFGNDENLSISSNGFHSFIVNNENNLYIRNNDTDGEIRLQGDDGTGFPFIPVDYLIIDGASGGVKLYGNYGDLKLQTVAAGVDVTGDLTVTGSVITSQIDSSDSSAIEIQTDVTMLAGLTVGNHIIPSSNENIDLGSNTNRFRELFLSGNTISLDSIKLSSASGALLVHDGAGSRSNIQSHNIDANDITANDIAVGGNLTMTGYIAGPATMTIDPAAVGDNTGTLVVAGNLQVDGTTTTINSQTLEVEDKNVVLGPNAANDAANNGAGLTVTQPDTSDATLIYNTTDTQWEFNKDVNVGSNDLQAARILADSATTPQTIYYVSSVEKGYSRINSEVLEHNGTAGVMLRHNGFEKLSTTTAGINVTGNLLLTSNNIIGRNTSDASDNGYIAVVGGGAESDGRGAIIRYYGNEHATNPGRLSLGGGNVTNADITFRASGVDLGRMDPDVDLYSMALSRFTGSSGNLLLEGDDTVVGMPGIQFKNTADSLNVNLIYRNEEGVEITSTLENDSGVGNDLLTLANTRVNTGSSAAGIKFVTNEISGSSQYVRAKIVSEYDDSSNVNGRLLFLTSDSSGSLQTNLKIKGNSQVFVGTSSEGENAGGTLWVHPLQDDNAKRTIYTHNDTTQITTNSTNYLHNVWIQNQDHYIDNGVTDSGYRIGLNIEGYLDDGRLSGTLATQKNIWSRAGNNSGGTGTITNLYNLHLDTLSGGGMTITNNWGLYQSGSGTKNYFEGTLGVGVDPGATPLLVNRAVSDTVSPATAVSKFRGSGGDGLAFGNKQSSPFGSWMQAGYLLDGYSPNFNSGYPIDINPIGGRVTIGSYETFSHGVNPKLSVTGSINTVHGGVDSSPAISLLCTYESNTNEANAILTSVSSNAATSGFYFDVSDGAGSSGRTRSMRINRGSVTVVGSLSKTSGSFKIPHPVPEKTETHDLVHSFVEAPQADNIYRGKIDLVSGRAEVNIDTVAGMTEGTFALLNREIQCFTSNESGWTAVRGSVLDNILTIEAQDNTCTDTISWLVIGERQDQHMYDTEWTDDNGKVIVEPLKDNGQD